MGVFKDGERNGQGTYTYGKGEWEGDKYVGDCEGRETGLDREATLWSNGNNYIGDWKDGKQTGQGTLTFPDGGIRGVQGRETEWTGNQNLVLMEPSM